MQNKTHIREWGKGNTKTAVLIHGMASSSHTWDEVGQELANHNFHVIAPDLFGHGDSSHTETYNLRSWGRGILKAVPHAPDLALGHSLGGLILARIHSTLQPKKTIFVDPAFFIPNRPMTNLVRKTLEKSFVLTEKNIRKKNPLWTDAQVEKELLTIERWDKKTVNGLPHTRYILEKYLTNPGTALALTAHRSIVLPTFLNKKLEKASVNVKKITGSGHMIHKDRFPEFMQEIVSFA